MSDIDNDETLAVPDELTALKSRADTLGITYHPNIGVEKLRDKVNAALAADAPAEPAEAAPELPPEVIESATQFKMRKRREANELIRVRVTCMNPAKSEWEGELFTAGNSNIGSFTKYVPFNADAGWHVPRIILNQLQQRQCQIFTTVRDERGNATRKGKLVKEFNIEILPNLTAEELHELAQRQTATRAIEG